MALLHVASLLLCYDGLQYANAVEDTHIAGTSGKEFFFAFFANYYVDPHSYLENDIYVSSTSDSLCTIDYDDGIRNLISINITAYSVTRKRLRGTTHLHAKSGIENKGIRILCTNPVSIYGFNRRGDYASSDAFTALPLVALSKEYIIPGVYNNPYIGVVATQNNTLVKIDLISSCSILFNGSLYKTGNILAVSLNINDALQIIHKESYETSLDCDFGGTYIQSTAPVAVFSGSVFYYPNFALYTYLVLQVPPISAYSTTVIVPRVPSPANHTVVRLVGSQNDTSMSITSVSHTDVKVIQHSLNWREFKDIDICLSRVINRSWSYKIRTFIRMVDFQCLFRVKGRTKRSLSLKAWTVLK
ncbi:uncharacterized protein LOC125373126 [Haliotis rufescens]|uniref:uncharacterized protein LOC125373126 n=1 Tax=Haliotis rufescens TaxID=6454 RepID=UPI00201F1542|nr:uncharacterized protein LOC125373126 [Haliotis rufescens]